LCTYISQIGSLWNRRIFSRVVETTTAETGWHYEVLYPLHHAGEIAAHKFALLGGKTSRAIGIDEEGTAAGRSPLNRTRPRIFFPTVSVKFSPSRFSVNAAKNACKFISERPALIIVQQQVLQLADTILKAQI
jgi:hypothetical protein